MKYIMKRTRGKVYSQCAPSVVDKHALLPRDVCERTDKKKAMPDNISEREVWEREYGILKVIPSSTRTQPSKALLLFSEILDFENMHKVLDVGCGIGRNSIYLAQKGCDVFAIDFSQTALNRLNNAAVTAGVTHRIRSCNCSLETPFPFQENSFDLVLDSYVFCHFTEDHLKQHYLKELRRVTKPDGIVFSSLFSLEDGYYGQMIGNMGGKDTIVVDPNNKIKKQLYTDEEIKAFLSSHFKLLYFVKFEFDDVVLRQTYRRAILVLVLKK